MDLVTPENRRPAWHRALDVAMWSTTWVMAVIALSAATFFTMLACWGGCTDLESFWFHLMFYTTLGVFIGGPIGIAIAAYRWRLRRTAGIYAVLGALLALSWLVLAVRHPGLLPGLG